MRNLTCELSFQSKYSKFSIIPNCTYKYTHSIKKSIHIQLYVNIFMTN